jgi:hypothetical protein
MLSYARYGQSGFWPCSCHSARKTPTNVTVLDVPGSNLGRLITYDGVSKSFRTGRLERELEMVQLSPTRCSCIAILWVSLVSFVAITLCVASQRVFNVVSVYFVIDSVRKLLDTPSYPYWSVSPHPSYQILRYSVQTFGCNAVYYWEGFRTFRRILLL